MKEDMKIVMKKPPVFPWAILVCVILIGNFYSRTFNSFLDSLPELYSWTIWAAEMFITIYGMVFLVRYWGEKSPREIVFLNEGLTIKLKYRNDNHTALKRTLKIKQKKNKLILSENSSTIGRVYRKRVAHPDSWNEVLSYFDIPSNSENN